MDPLYYAKNEDVYVEAVKAAYVSGTRGFQGSPG